MLHPGAPAQPLVRVRDSLQLAMRRVSARGLSARGLERVRILSSGCIASRLQGACAVYAFASRRGSFRCNHGSRKGAAEGASRLGPKHATRGLPGPHSTDNNSEATQSFGGLTPLPARAGYSHFTVAMSLNIAPSSPGKAHRKLAPPCGAPAPEPVQLVLSRGRCPMQPRRRRPASARCPPPASLPY
jgi:hypothetical protein